VRFEKKTIPPFEKSKLCDLRRKQYPFLKNQSLVIRKENNTNPLKDQHFEKKTITP